MINFRTEFTQHFEERCKHLSFDNLIGIIDAVNKLQKSIFEIITYSKLNPLNPDQMDNRSELLNSMDDYLEMQKIAEIYLDKKLKS